MISMLAIAAAGQMAWATSSVDAKYLGVNSAGRSTAKIVYPGGNSHVYVGESRFRVSGYDLPDPLLEWKYASEQTDGSLIVRHAYCIDVFEQIHTNHSHTWDLGDLTTAPNGHEMSELQALQLTYLYNTVLPDPEGVSWDYNNAWQFQLAVWEIATGTPDYNLQSASGAFYVTNRSASLAQSWLDDLAANYDEVSDFDGMDMDTVLAMVNDGTQDFMVGFERPDLPPNHVPEPMTMLSAGFGLAAVGRYIRRRRRA